MQLDSSAVLVREDEEVRPQNQASRSQIFATVAVASLGYFVDVYDLSIFGIVRIASLQALGVAESAMLEVGVFLINMQVIGMLIGGVAWGILGDKKGRMSVLFSSILIYSLANLANAFVTSVEQYAVLRFIAGFGLAGELGAAITLVAEIMPKESRGIGTTIVATMGICGGIAATIIGELFSWQTTYIIGGVLGLLLLLMRVKLAESGIFSSGRQNKDLVFGQFRMFFNRRERFRRYMACILVGVPIWFVLGVMMPFSPEITRELGMSTPVSAGLAIMYSTIGVAIGDFASGLLSQFLRSRKKVVAAFLGLIGLLLALCLSGVAQTPGTYYVLCLILGFGAGFWAVLVTIAAEQFGTNLRATAATTVPNFVRGAVAPLSILTASLKPYWGFPTALLIVGSLSLIIAAFALAVLKESYGRDLNFFEE